jgi:hypothetical protein
MNAMGGTGDDVPFDDLWRLLLELLPDDDDAFMPIIVTLHGGDLAYEY